MASEALAKFSDLLRYQLYECNEHEIPLKQELTYLENYIELEKLRQNTDNLEITVQLERHNSRNLTIAPFVLIPFIENAFKHVPQLKDQQNWIKMDLRFDHHQLHFTISNSIHVNAELSQQLIQYRGIGLKNVQRRLDLIYPGEHELTIRQDDNQFQVTLYLGLHEHKVSERMGTQVKQ